MVAQESSPSLKAQLSAALPQGQVLDSADLLAYVAQDVYRGGGEPLCVLRPASVEDLQTAVKLCAEAGVAIVPRGGGASYTDGYLYGPGGHVLIDTRDLTAMEIDESNAIVTVEAGVTWADLKAALDARGLRTPFWGPFSGIAATVGGSVSQNSVSHGTAAHGISAQSVLGLDVVLANGDLLTTNAASSIRNYGPDLTGLFTGDCGTLGVKARIRLPLINAQAHAEALSFAFDTFEAYHAAVRRAQMARVDDSHFMIDLALSQGQIGRQQGAGAKAKIAWAVFQKAPNKIKGLQQLLKMALAGEDPMRSGQYMCHFIVEGFDATDAAHRANYLRQVIGDDGREIANTIPTFVRSMPFAPLGNILGPNGERWVPIHGVLNHDQVVPFHRAYQAMLAARKADMERLGVWTGTMASPVNSSGFLYEVALYWPDARTAYHDTTLGAEWIAGLTTYPANAEAKALANELKEATVALMQRYGSGHFQIGRAYPYQSRLAPPASALVRGLKAQLDPKGVMNPGALGF
ncbi:FAD-binding oxidoreductase [Novosphingobium umbonatum]|uniref:FAD-binding oxidoreductase n=1 Tax=Novosphingobium umbonatum TaxID=1908524 RepID=A0A3S2UU49_9SPHN|nr:FAD-binding oxidoreductase [Novosphingobium umbonatum]RVU06983.1 FAD-binding oxidoreductase [Novosphingobium umbonatum]